ncbi:MAG TPA: fructosamine kinase family protein [Acidimicrobiales bacterium]|jgi:fructosamine-3-kinase|nr:fructosamine kinase family protein [Acidimicrobiales bacterium]
MLIADVEPDSSIVTTGALGPSFGRPTSDIMGPMEDDTTADLARLLGESVSSMHPLRGGDVAEAYRVMLAGGRTLFAKTHRRPPPGFFTTEANGLAWLRAAEALPVPAVLAVSDGADGAGPWLVLDWINESPGAAPDDAAFGRALAALHQVGAPSFGREDRRPTGSRGLPNQPCPTWTEFYATQRLMPLAALLRNTRHLGDDGARLAAGLETVAERISELAGPAEPPARLHGDLWAGNRLVDTGGRSWLIDPACFGGHREFDLAMMRLFGGFGPQAFVSYSEVAPLAAGWEARIPLHQMAPLAVHAVKFGGGYPARLAGALRAVGA